MNYDPKDASSVIPEGEYEASIAAVTSVNKDGEQLRSKDGYEMVCVTFEVYVGDAARKLFVYFTASPKALFRYRQLALALGQEAQFKLKQFQAADNIGANLRITVGIKDDPKYGEQNTTDAFAPSAVTAKRTPAKADPVRPVGVMPAEDIPF